MSQTKTAFMARITGDIRLGIYTVNIRSTGKPTIYIYAYRIWRKKKYILKALTIELGEASTK